jgi:NADPH2:quinone reductase
MQANLSLRFVMVYTIPPAALRSALADIGTALHDHALTALPVHRFPLDRIAEAHDAAQEGVLGKVLVDIP